MMPALNIDRLISDVPKGLLSLTRSSGTYSVSDLKQSDGRMSLVAAIRKQFPVVLLWMRDHINDHAFAQLGPASNAVGASRLWRLDTHSDIARIVRSLNEGGWALFFFQDEKAAQIQPPEHLPSDGSKTPILVRELGAGAAIVSWYDDKEWILAVPTAGA